MKGPPSLALDPPGNSRRVTTQVQSKDAQRTTEWDRGGGAARMAQPLLIAIGVVGCLRAGSLYYLFPWLGLLLPCLSLCWSHHSRQKLADRTRANWLKIVGYSERGGSPPWGATLAWVVIPFVLFDLSSGAMLGAVDTRPVIPTALSLTTDGDLDVSELAAGPAPLILRKDGSLPASFQRQGEAIYSAFPLGMVPFALPVVALARICGADLEELQVLLRLEKITAASVAGMGLGLFFLCASRLAPPAPALVVTALLATGSAMWTTSGLGLWQHGGVVVWLLVALTVEFQRGGKVGPWGTAAQGLACAMMLVCRPTSALLVAGLGTWVLLRSPRRAVCMALLAGLAWLPWLLLHRAIYGNLLGPSTVNMNLSSQYWSFLRADRLAGVLFCPARGLFVYQPWAVLSLAGLAVTLARQGGKESSWLRCTGKGVLGRGGLEGWPIFAVAVSALHIVVIAAWHDWSGGHCWGSRLLTDILPLLGFMALPAVSLAMRSRWGIAALGMIAVLGFLAQVPCVAWDAHRWNAVNYQRDMFWSWGQSPFFYFGP